MKYDVSGFSGSQQASLVPFESETGNNRLEKRSVHESEIDKSCYKKPVNALVLIILLLSTMIVPAVADGTPPGDSGIGDITMGASANNVYITPPSGISDWKLDPIKGMNKEEETISVKADGDWKVVATDNDPATSGQMTEWYGGSYVSNPKKLSAMSISATDPGEYVDAVSEKTIPTTEWIARGSDTQGQYINVPITFKQPVSWGNQVLTGGHSYRIVVTFTISGY